MWVFLNWAQLSELECHYAKINKCSGHNFSLRPSLILCQCWRRQEHLFLNQQKDQASQLVNLQPERLKQIRHPQHQLEVLLHLPPHLRLLIVMLPVGNLNLEPNRLQKPRQVEISPTQIPPSPLRTMYMTRNLSKLILVHRQVWLTNLNFKNMSSIKTS